MTAELTPVLFDVSHMVAGQGFYAGFRITNGRALFECEDNVWTMSGVNPATEHGSGDTPKEAWADFVECVKETLLHFAEESADFASFQQSVCDYLCQDNDVAMLRWGKAREAVRSGQQQDAQFEELPKRTDECPTTIDIVQLADIPATPALPLNRPNRVGKLAKAA